MRQSKGNNIVLASLLMVLSTSSFTLSGFFAGPSIKGSSFWLALFVRFMIPLVFVTPLYLAETKRLRVERNHLHMARAFFLVISQGLFFITSIKSSLFQAVVLYNTGPFFILLLDSVYFKKAIPVPSMFGVALGFVGTLLVLWEGFKGTNYFFVTGVLSGVFFALSQFSLYLGAKTSSNRSILFHTYLFGAIFALVPAVLTGATRPSAMGTALTAWSSVGSLVLMGLFSLGNQWFRGIAYQYTNNISAITPYLYFGIVVSVLLDYVSHDKIPSMLSVAGACCIVTGSLVSSMLGRRTPKASTKDEPSTPSIKVVPAR